MRASDDLEAAGLDAAQPCESVDLMRAKPGQTADAQRDHVSLRTIGQVA